MKKHFWLITGITLGLFFIGLFISPTVLKWTEKIIGEEIVGLTTSEFLVPPVSLGLLLAFCSIYAGCLLWAYSKNNFGYDPKLIFGLGLLVSLVTAAIAIGTRLLYIRYLLHLTGNDIDNIPMVMNAINYFSWGFKLPLFANIILTAILLWFSNQRQKRSNNVPIHNE